MNEPINNNEQQPIPGAEQPQVPEAAQPQQPVPEAGQPQAIPEMPAQPVEPQNNQPQVMTPEQVLQQPATPPVPPQPQVQPQAPQPNMAQVTPRIDNTEVSPQVTGNAPVQQPKKKGGKGLLFILFLLVIGTVVYLGRDTFMSFINPKQEAKQETKETENVTTVDDSLKTQLNKKVGTLLADDTFTDVGRYNAYGFRPYILKSSITDQIKQYVILSNAKYEQFDDSWEDVKVVKDFIEQEKAAVTASGQTYDESSTLKEFGYITKNAFDESTKSLFGTELKNPINEIGSCPTYNYDSTKEMFIMNPARCGGTSAAEFLGYINKYERNNNIVTVYLNIGLNTPEGVYVDFDLGQDQASQLKNTQITPKGEAIEVTEKNPAGMPIINDKNYKDFSEYKLTFKKLDDEEFYFSKIEQVK